MPKVIYILGQARCGSSAFGYAIGNHNGITNLGETQSWLYGRTRGLTSCWVNFSHPPSDVLVDSSKSIWRLGHWLRSGYDVRIVWLRRNVTDCIRSRLRRRNGYSVWRCIVDPILSEVINRLYLIGKSYCVVGLSELKNHNKKARERLELHTGESLHNLYLPFDPWQQRYAVMTGNYETADKGVQCLE